MRRNRRSQYLFGMTLLAVVLSTAIDAHAQTLPSPSPEPAASPLPSLESEFFKNVLRDQKAIWTSPFHLERDDAKWMIPLSLGSMALITTDRITGDEIAESEALVKASRIVSYGGSTYGVGAVAASFYLVGRTKHNARARETGLLSAEAILDGAIVAHGLKAITQRVRPLDGNDRSEFFDGGSSFPSGHSVETWSLATIIAEEYSDHRAVQVAAYGAATAVSLSRFTGHKHYLSDVLVGSAIGFGIGHYVYHAHHRPVSGSDDQTQITETRWPSIAPLYSRSAHQYGVAVRWSF